MREQALERQKIAKLDDFTQVPNSYVNDNGKPNLNNSNVESDIETRVSVRYSR